MRTALRSFAACLVLFAAACAENPAVTTTGTGGGGTGTGGAGTGGGGTGGTGGGSDFVCPESGITKGPWAMAATGTGVTIRWEACKAGTKGELRFSPEGGDVEVEAASVETAFEVTETFTAPLQPGTPPDAAGTYYMHDAKLDKLEPGACYTYHLAADPAKKGRFCTARPAGEPFTFYSIGDTNPGLNGYSSKLIEQLLPKKGDFTLHGGDVQYYESGLETYASWFPLMQPLLAQGAFYPAIGNHEKEKPTEYEQYTKRFFGGAGFDGVDEYYRFESGGVWFFSVNTEASVSVGSPQAAWLEQQIADAAAKPGYRFGVVYFHKPWVTCGDKGDDPKTREYFEPLFLKHGVRFVIQAHMHGYERFEFDGITYLTIAGGGGVLAKIDENKDRDYCDKRVSSGAFRHAAWFDVKAGEIVGTVVDDTGAVRDTFTAAVP